MTDDDIQAAIDEAEAAQWEEEQAQVRFAEAGGYAAGRARPSASWERIASVYADDGSNDISF